MKLHKRLIHPDEVEGIKEKKSRVFKLSYVKNGEIFRYEKIFQKKENIRKYLNDPDVIKTKIYVGDVVDK